MQVNLLIATNLTKSDGTWLISVWLLDTTGRWRRLASGLGGELLTRGLATSGLASGLLGSDDKLAMIATMIMMSHT